MKHPAKQPLAVSVAVRIYRALLMAWPGRSGGNFTSEMAQVFADICRRAYAERGLPGLVQSAVYALGDLCRRAPQEWMAHVRPTANNDTRLPHKPRSHRRPGSATKPLVFDPIVHDVRFALRSLIKNPGYATAVILTLALGVGANTAIFSIVHGVLLTPLPYPNADRIVTIAETSPVIDIPPKWASVSNYLDWKEQSAAFEFMALFRGRSRALTGGDEPLYIYTAFVTAEFFDVFATEPFLGRGFTPSENEPGADQVVVLSHVLWKRRYGSDSSMVGKTIELDGQTPTVVGIMPPGFSAPARWIDPDVSMDLWLPFTIDLAATERVNRSYFVVGRLRGDATLDRAQSDLDVISAQLRDAYPGANANWITNLIPWHEVIVGNVRAPLLLIWAAVGFVLLIACANVANLKLNRMLSRRSEITIRAALGAGRGRLMRQVLTESMVLALAGGLVGSAFAVGAVKLVLAVHPGNIPLIDRVGISLPVLGVTFAMVLGTSVLFGALPALYAARSDLAAGIRNGGMRALGDGRRDTRNAIAVVQLVLAFTLLLGAGLVGKSLVRLMSVSPGLNPDQIFTATVALPWNRVSTLEARAAFVTNVLARLEAEPGVTSAAMINSLPFTGSNVFQPIWIDGHPRPAPERAEVVAFRGVSPGYFGTMEIPLLQGRDFDRRDLANPQTAVVNEMMARRYWPDESPIGKRFNIFGTDVNLTVVGVVGNVKHYGLDEPPKPEVYQPYTGEFLTTKSFLVHTAGDPAGFGPRMRQIILAIDPDQPIRDMGTMQAYVGRSTANPRFNAIMLGVASLVAVVLAAVGLFGVVSYTVTEQTREIGIRMALGAGQGGVVGAIVKRGAVLAAVGVGGGIGISALTGRALEGLLFGITAHDAATYVVVSLGFIVITVAASYLPARRASRVDPMIALREL
ncbi:MAG: ABC transporter permease [Gemmatimonadetes bacterium]|nr:ABC transporter permease [Gemmatimonadota bacterium]